MNFESRTTGRQIHRLFDLSPRSVLPMISRTGNPTVRHTGSTIDRSRHDRSSS